jgi:hypothetical protein
MLHSFLPRVFDTISESSRKAGNDGFEIKEVIPTPLPYKR